MPTSRAGPVKASDDQAEQERQRSSGKITLGAGKLISQVCILLLLRFTWQIRSVGTRLQDCVKATCCGQRLGQTHILRCSPQVVGGSGSRVRGTKGALHVWQPTMAVLGGFLVLFLWQCSRRKRLLLLRRRGGDTTRRRLAL